MNYSIGFWFLARLTGLSYFFALLSLYPQIPGLIGPHGILPAETLLSRATQVLGPAAPWALPSLGWIFGTSVSALHLIALLGIVGSLLLLTGFLRPIGAILSWLGWLSFVNIGQDFLSFQWDTLLLEVGFLVIFLEKPGLRPRPPGPDTPPLLIRLALTFLIFRLMFSSGIVKILSGDPTWTDLSAMTYHFFTQPIPNPLAWFIQQLPHPLLHLSTLFTFAIELLLPFTLLFPQPKVRLTASLGFLSLMLLIGLTGNYAFFNLLTIALCLPLIHNRYWPLLLQPNRIALPWTPIPWRHLASLAALLQLSLAIPILLSTLQLFPRSASVSWQNSLAPWHLTSGYGLFAVMTTRRPELTLERSSNGLDWQPILFSDKAGPPDRLPPQIAPFQPRLDWQMWFAALSAERGQLPGWFSPFLKKLQKGEPDVWDLLPSPPHSSENDYLRLRLDQYRFTTPSERSSTGNWWHITPGPVILVLSPETAR
ncbi:MAG: lipase maturation factor family protein [Verrucomicrobia bacterium]|nr:lipase maturation factor family protein [Verrucomicrobiota bacterium]